MKVNYDWIKEYVGSAMPKAAEFDRLLTEYAFEIEEIEQVGGQTVIDVDVLPNRSSDCLCHRGIARELASILAIELEHDPLRNKPVLTLTDKVAVNIADTKACPRFTASLVTGIEVKQSPEWLKTRLESLGQRSINNIVDATNYVMYAIGQPLHAYDADLFPQVDGKWQFGVRYAIEGETVSLLAEGGAEALRVIECRGDELLIVDESSNTPIGLAGVKGGKYAGVHAETKNIIIEAAHFHPTITRKTARRLGIVIDASKRFENEPAQELPPYGQFEIIALIKDIAGGKYEGTLDVYTELKKNPTVTVRQDKVNALLGLELTTTEVKDILIRTGTIVTDGSEDGVLTCVGPWERTDLLLEADFIEEVGRLYGLSNIISVVPEPSQTSTVNVRQYYTEQMRQTLLKLGFSEVITSSFQKKDKIQLQNALASDKSYLRSSLVKNLTKALDENYSRTDVLGIRAVMIFEIGTVFDKTETGVSEHISLALGVRQKGNGYTPKDDAPLQAAVTALEEKVGVDLGFVLEKGVAEADLSAVIEHLPVPNQYESFVPKEAATFARVSPYPATARDIALWVNEGAAADVVMKALQESAGELCTRVDLFDEFIKDGRTSFAFRLVFQSFTHTLTDSEIDTVMEVVYATVADHGWEVR